ARSLLRRSDGRWLLFRYPFNDGSWRWIIPGGGAELGEGPIEAVTREVLEETGTTPRELRHTGMLMYHLLATSMRTGTPRLQYSPVLVGEIDDELPDTGGRETHWLTLEEFTAQPHRPVTDPLISLMRLVEHDEPLEPAAIWLPA
ncbi:MAG: pyrophosphohydrolase, partial [Thermoleophilia bacterium]|nr:pyrophosphohydrolase [Thermoleophilia bacterium]